MSEIFVTKNNGETEPFNKEKLAESLMRSGVSEEEKDKVVAHIVHELTPGMRTSDIYRHAFSLLSKHEKRAALNYSVRRAILDLGPSGFPFEQLVAEIFKRKGYEVSTDKYVKGHCAEHEVDVIAFKGKELVMLEAKFHNVDGVKSDLKVALYVKARFDDLRQATFNYGEATKMTRGILVTNTKFTHTAVSYAECAGLELLGWNYPKENNLQDMIQEGGLHPVTCLDTLSKKDKKYLLDKNIVFLRDLKDNDQVFDDLRIDKDKREHIMGEINQII